MQSEDNYRTSNGVLYWEWDTAFKFWGHLELVALKYNLFTKYIWSKALLSYMDKAEVEQVLLIKRDQKGLAKIQCDNKKLTLLKSHFLSMQWGYKMHIQQASSAFITPRGYKNRSPTRVPLLTTQHRKSTVQGFLTSIIVFWKNGNVVQCNTSRLLRVDAGV